MPRSPLLHSAVSGQRRRAALDVEAVVPRSLGDVALQEAVAVLLHDHEPVHAAVSDPVSADDVVGAADERMLDSEADARAVSVRDEVVRDEVAVPLLDPDAVAASARRGFG